MTAIPDRDGEPFDLTWHCPPPPEVERAISDAGCSARTESPLLLRLMVHTLVVGQAAGAAAAERCGAPLWDVAPDAIQDERERQGVDRCTAERGEWKQ